MADFYKVYKIINTIDDKIYIGSTSKTLEERFKQHLYDATRNNTIKLYKHMRYLGFEYFRIELICERFTTNHKFLEQLHINKYDESVLLNTAPADSSCKLTPYQKDRRDMLNKIRQKICDHNILHEDKWDINLIDINSPNWILEKLLVKINGGVFTELFTDGRLCFY